MTHGRYALALAALPMAIYLGSYAALRGTHRILHYGCGIVGDASSCASMHRDCALHVCEPTWIGSAFLPIRVFEGWLHLLARPCPHGSHDSGRSFVDA